MDLPRLPRSEGPPLRRAPLLLLLGALALGVPALGACGSPEVTTTQDPAPGRCVRTDDGASTVVACDAPDANSVLVAEASGSPCPAPERSLEMSARNPGGVGSTWCVVTKKDLTPEIQAKIDASRVAGTTPST